MMQVKCKSDKSLPSLLDPRSFHLLKSLHWYAMYRIYCLTTSFALSKQNWMTLPMVSSVIAQLKSLPNLLASSAARSFAATHALRSAPRLVPWISCSARSIRSSTSGRTVAP